MKKLFALAAVALFASTAAATDLALWTFESSVPVSAGPFTAEAGVNAGTSNALGATNGVYSNPVGNGSFESFSSTAWDVGDYYEFTTSTTGYTSIVLSFDHASSNTGPRDFNVLYSTDGGANFVSAGSYAVLANATPNTPWSSGSYNPAYFSSFSLNADNAASLIVRLTQSTTVSANGGAVAATGTSRVDNVLIAGTIPTPGTIGLLSIAGVVATRRRRA